MHYARDLIHFALGACLCIFEISYTWVLQAMHTLGDINFHVIYILIMSLSIDIMRRESRLAGLVNKSKVLRAIRAA